MKLVGIVADRLENRWLGTGILRPNQRVDDSFGLLDEIEQGPRRIDGRAGHLEEVGGEKLAESLDDHREALARGVGDRPQHGDGGLVRIDAGGEISLGRLRRLGGLPGAIVRLAHRAARRGRADELLQKEEDQSVHQSAPSTASPCSFVPRGRV